MGIVRMGVPTELVEAFQDASKITAFIETGTYRGDTARWAATRFTQVYTIERAEHLYETATRTLADCKNLKVMLGDSRDRLRELCIDLDTAAVFWLDGHFSGLDTSGSDDQCPLLAELSIVGNRKFNDVILIDDARLFLCMPPAPLDMNQWPTLDELIRVLPADYWIQVLEDVIVCVKKSDEANSHVLRDYSRQLANLAWQTYGQNLNEQSKAPSSLRIPGLRRLKAMLRRNH
jgi:hypothetical protein